MVIEPPVEIVGVEVVELALVQENMEGRARWRGRESFVVDSYFTTRTTC
jgi:hypothetical protein